MNIVYYYKNPKGVEFATPNPDVAVARATYYGTFAYSKEESTNAETND